MTKLSYTYRLLVVTLLLCICTESVLFLSQEEQKSVDIEQHDDNQNAFVNSTQIAAVIPATTFQVVKWLYVIDLFTVETFEFSINHIETLNLVLSYFEVLFEVCIPINAP